MALSVNAFLKLQTWTFFLIYGILNFESSAHILNIVNLYIATYLLAKNLVFIDNSGWDLRAVLIKQSKIIKIIIMILWNYVYIFHLPFPLSVNDQTFLKEYNQTVVDVKTNNLSLEVWMAIFRLKSTRRNNFDINAMSSIWTENILDNGRFIFSKKIKEKALEYSARLVLFTIKKETIDLFGCL